MAVIIPVVSKFDDKGIKQAQSAFSGLGASMKGILGAAGISIGLSSIVNGLKQSTVAAIEDTKSQALLANQLRNTIGASDAQISSVEASIAAMQKQAAVADDEIRPAFASLVRATGDVARATSLTSLALDVAAGTGKDLGAVSLALGKAVNGSATALVKLVPSLKNAKDPMAALQAEFSGAAKAAADNDPIKQLSILFGDMQEQIGMALLPSLQRFSSWMSGSDGTALVNGLVRAFEDLVAEANLAAEGIGYLSEKTVQLAKDVNISVEIDDTAKAIAGIGSMAIKSVNPINALIQSLQLLGMLGRLDPTTKFDPTRAGDPSAGRYAALEAAAKIAAQGTNTTRGTGGAKTVATNYVKEFATSMADELRKQMARVRLGNKGLSAELIESIVGSGKSWYTVYQSILNSSDTALGRLQKNWNATSAGIKELESISKAAADAAKEASDAAAAIAKEASDKAIAAAEDALSAAQGVVAELQSLADAAKAEADKYSAILSPLPPTVIEVYQSAVDNLAKLQEESKRTLDDMAKGMADIRAEADSAATAFKDLAKTAEPIGAWEAKLNDSFANLTASAQKAFDNKLITADAYKNLMAYANREKALLTDIAKKRDALAEKISLAKALYADTKSAVMNFGNITGLLKSQSETITETTSKMVDGVATTITRSIEKISSTDLVAEYRKIIDKTKAFSNNLKTLRDQGLNKELFAQIVGAGVDVGGQTAAALAAGGPAVITELNGLFAELQTVSDSVAETTTVVMYNNGVEVVGGFINGLLAEDKGLADAAATIAAIFADTFKANLSSAMDSVFAAMKAQLDAAIAAAKAALDLALSDLKKASDAAIAAAAAAAAALAAAQADAAKKDADLKNLIAPIVAPVVTPTTALDNIVNDYITLAPNGGAGALGFRGGTSKVDGGNVINVTVNAGLGTNGAVLGGQIVDLIKKYEKTSGTVFA